MMKRNKISESSQSKMLPYEAHTNCELCVSYRSPHKMKFFVIFPMCRSWSFLRVHCKHIVVALVLFFRLFCQLVLLLLLLLLLSLFSFLGVCSNYNHYNFYPLRLHQLSLAYRKRCTGHTKSNSNMRVQYSVSEPSSRFRVAHTCFKVVISLSLNA